MNKAIFMLLSIFAGLSAFADGNQGGKTIEGAVWRILNGMIVQDMLYESRWESALSWCKYIHENAHAVNEYSLTYLSDYAKEGRDLTTGYPSMLAIARYTESGDADGALSLVIRYREVLEDVMSERLREAIVPTEYMTSPLQDIAYYNSLPQEWIKDEKLRDSILHQTLEPYRNLMLFHQNATTYILRRKAGLSGYIKVDSAAEVEAYVTGVSTTMPKPPGTSKGNTTTPKSPNNKSK